MVYHGILLDTEFEDRNFIYRFKILGSKKSERNPWMMYKVEAANDDIEKIMKEVQVKLIDGSYAHFYSDNEIIVVFKKKIFRLTADKSTWKPFIDYGKSIGIPAEQLDMKSCRFEDEVY